MRRTLIYLSIIFLFTSCFQEDDFPSPTQEGANTFGCYINGEQFKTKGNVTVRAASAYLTNTGNLKYISIGGDRAHDETPQSVNLSVYYDNLMAGEREFDLKRSYNGDVTEDGSIVYYKLDSAWASYKIAGTYEFYSNTDYTGKLHISRFDPDNMIISGIFYFDAINSEGEVVKITDGRFDFTYSSLID
ncbi:hypothetical protein [Aureibacter tunicatorum]|uniref:Lipoprotein n=1 Tax=Aureibacter tunicatorum TaxID=866807 RepID=A0AAE3XQM2_9BACT|nr:hypothetical protein [Aureibacter tunicatorum]MDR6240278.1 hypothetical protein [Aureibacter tunicatorum]BDD05841.1 hypothetical protein AUTU_33240 [Aureibacter tunicatorum]